MRSLVGDITKDINSINDYSRPGFVPLIWVCGLAKSGTTLLEDIVSQRGYVDAYRSPLRKYHRTNQYNLGKVTDKLFENMPKDKRSFLKTHTPYTEELDNIIRGHNISIIISARDIKDALVSRYHHILSDVNHWQHSLIKQMSEDKRKAFECSIKMINPDTRLCTAEYFAKWINDWKKSPYSRNIVWYESYKKNPIHYIENSFNILSLENNDSACQIEVKLKRKRNLMDKLVPSMALRRIIFGHKSGTYRKGKTGTYQDYCTDETNMLFEQLEKSYDIGGNY